MSFWSGITEGLGLNNRNQINDANKTLSGVLDKSNETSTQNRALYEDYLSKMNDLYGANAGKYDEALANLEGAIGEGYDTFTPSGSVEDFYDKFANQRAASAVNAINNSQANAGNMFSSDYINQLAAKQQALASEEWSKAYDKYNTNLNQQLQQFNTNATQKQNYLNNLGTLATTYGNDRSNLANSYDNYLSNIANQNNSDLSNYANVVSQIANNKAQKTNGIGSMVGLGAQIAGAFL